MGGTHTYKHITTRQLGVKATMPRGTDRIGELSCDSDVTGTRGPGERRKPMGRDYESESKKESLREREKKY